MIRRLLERDLPDLCRLSRAAGWNQTSEDWNRLLRLEPDGCIGIEQDGHMVATVTALCHDQRLAWLGMVLTRAECRRRGYARQLVGAALDYVDSRRIATVRLDAADDARALYREYGFTDEHPIERWMREPPLTTCVPHGLPRGCVDLALDRSAFGADRSRLLATLVEPFRFDGGYLMHRAGSLARYLGPCVARDAAAAERAIRAVVAAYVGEAWFWDVMPPHIEIARRLGFVPVRRLTRMRRGAILPADNSLVLAIGGFEAG